MDERRKYYEPVGQGRKRPNDLGVLHDGILSPGAGRQAFCGAAYSAGLATGLFFLNPALFKIGAAEKAERIMDVFYVFSLCLYGYAAFLLAGFFFARDNIRMIRFAFIWLIIPVIAIWGIIEIAGVLYERG
ncbi:MAG: hypothetical protein WC989_02795 [Micavibrio sp.]